MGSVDRGLLLVRVGVGLTLAAHGARKLFGWFGGRGLAATGAGFEAMGFEPGRRSALAAGLGEAGGGALLALGLATPMAGAAAAGTMAVAASTHVPNGFFNAHRGLEFPMTLGLVATALTLTGPGALSVDRLIGFPSTCGRLRLVASLAAAGTAGTVIARRRQVLARRASEGARGAPGGANGEAGATHHPAGAGAQSASSVQETSPDGAATAGAQLP